jgi:hypothetical protein
MKDFLRFLILILSIAVIVGFFLPWISLEVEDKTLLEISGYELITEMDSLEKISGLDLFQIRVHILLIPLLCLYTLIALILDWKSIFLILPSLVLTGYFIYLYVDSFDAIKSVYESVLAGWDYLDSIPEKIRKSLDIDTNILGTGLYLTCIGFIVLVLVELRELFTSDKK